MALLAIATLSFVTALCVYGIATVLFISSAPPVIWYAMALLIGLTALLTLINLGLIVSLQAPSVQTAQQILIGFIIGWMLIEVLPRISLSVSPQVFPLITAAIFALVMFCNGYFLGMQRFYALALFCLLVGGGASLATDWYTGCLTVIELTGVWLVVSGGVTFWRYRRMSHHQEYAE
jgi:hypothetical protein